ncbi:hypothetical protein CJ030_MR3G025357 [Morella rubra]|nr:hypothetical protein CJ030_MR3G025357 [Morella rubra]
MDLIIPWNLRASAVSFPPIITTSCFFFNRPSLSPDHKFPVSFWTYPIPYIPNMSHIIAAQKRDSDAEPILKPTIVEEVSLDDEEEEALFDDFEDEASMNDIDDYFEDEDVADYTEVYVGDGGGGGGISLAGTWWDKEALRIAEEVSLSFDGDLKIYAFRTMSNSTIQVRIEKLSKKSGSPGMEDIEAFSSTYRARLDEAKLSKTVPENIWLEGRHNSAEEKRRIPGSGAVACVLDMGVNDTESNNDVSSPGVERVVRIPHELDRFKDRPMYVKYVNLEASGSLSESDGVFRLVSFDMESKCCTWGLADVRENREKAGKGRPLSKKQRDWRLDTPFDSLRLVRLYPEI